MMGALNEFTLSRRSDTIIAETVPELITRCCYPSLANGRSNLVYSLYVHPLCIAKPMEECLIPEYQLVINISTQN